MPSGRADTTYSIKRDVRSGTGKVCSLLEIVGARNSAVKASVCTR